MNRLNRTLFPLAVLLIVCFGVGFQLAVGCSNPPTPAQIDKVESDLCKARATYKLIAAAAGGRLDPLPGSPRAKLEAAEDAFCATRADGGP